MAYFLLIIVDSFLFYRQEPPGSPYPLLVADAVLIMIMYFSFEALQYTASSPLLAVGLIILIFYCFQ